MTIREITCMLKDYRTVIHPKHGTIATIKYTRIIGNAIVTVLDRSGHDILGTIHIHKGLIHKDDGPAIITYNTCGDEDSHTFFLKGTKYTKEEYINILKDVDENSALLFVMKYG